MPAKKTSPKKASTTNRPRPDSDGSFSLDHLTSAEGLVLPTEIGGFLSLNGLTSAEGLVLPKKIGGSLWLNGLASAEGLVLPKKIGGSLWLDGLTSAEGLVLPEEIGGDLYLKPKTVKKAARKRTTRKTLTIGKRRAKLLGHYLDQLLAFGVKQVVVTFGGEGDDGSIDQIQYVRAADDAIYTSPPLDSAFEDLVYDILSIDAGLNWWNERGDCGEMRLAPELRTLELDITTGGTEDDFGESHFMKATV